MYCLLQPLGPLHRAGRLQILAIEGQGSGRVHPGGCAARRPGCLLRFLPLQQPGAGRGRGRGGEIKQAGELSLPRVSQAGLAASHLSQLRNWETFHCSPKRRCPQEWRSGSASHSVSASSSGVCTISILVQTCSIPGPIKKILISGVGLGFRLVWLLQVCEM